MANNDVIEAYFNAMRQGAAAEQDLLALFAPDAVYIEPFSGITEPALGVEQIRDRFRQGWAIPLLDMELDILEMVVDGPNATATWECRSPGLPGPARGRDLYEIRNGLITRLEVQFLERPA